MVFKENNIFLNNYEKSSQDKSCLQLLGNNAVERYVASNND